MTSRFTLGTKDEHINARLFSQRWQNTRWSITSKHCWWLQRPLGHNIDLVWVSSQCAKLCERYIQKMESPQVFACFCLCGPNSMNTVTVGNKIIACNWMLVSFHRLSNIARKLHGSTNFCCVFKKIGWNNRFNKSVLEKTWQLGGFWSKAFTLSV